MKNWLEQEVAEQGMEQGAKVTEIGLSGEQKFCCSHALAVVHVNVQQILQNPQFTL